MRKSAVAEVDIRHGRGYGFVIDNERVMETRQTTNCA
jgi:hypothetical protein